jgi:hypothetical protein
MRDVMRRRWAVWVGMFAAAWYGPMGVSAEQGMKTTVHREADRVWIEGVGGWFCGEKESSVHAAQEAVMQAVGEDTTYDYLVGVSGLAFRMQISKVGFCPSSPHSCCGYQCVARSTQALPWKVSVFEVKAAETGKVAEARRAVVASINRGVPVQYGSEEDGVIVGYQKNGEEWICLHPYRDGGKKTFVETKWPWGIAVFSERKAEMPSRRDLASGVLQQAVAMAKAGEAGQYFVGFNAWDEYIKRLKALEGADEKARKDAMQGNAWIYECLAQYRGCAARYLRGVAGEFDPGVAAHLLKVADLYERMSGQVLTDAEHCVVDVAPYPFALKDGKTWTAEMRQEQVRRLEAAFPLEREAIGEIEKAVALLKPGGGGQPSTAPEAGAPGR